MYRRIVFVMDPFVRQSAELSRAHRTRAKWVFVPSPAIAPTFVQWIAQNGNNWLDPRCVKPFERRLGAPFVSQRADAFGHFRTGARPVSVHSREGCVQLS